MAEPSNGTGPGMCAAGFQADTKSKGVQTEGGCLLNVPSCYAEIYNVNLKTVYSTLGPLKKNL